MSISAILENIPIAKRYWNLASHVNAFKDFRRGAWAYFALAAMLLLTLSAYFALEKRNVDAARAQFEFRKAEALYALERRLVAYTLSLKGGLGLFKSSSHVSRKEWHEYVAALDLETDFPGIQGLGYAEFVKPEDRTRYEDRIRSEGFAEFTIRPKGERALYSSITYLEPFDLRNRQAFGYDMYSQETRRAAMNIARDTGKVAISGKVTLVQEITDDVQAGFLIYVPYYGVGAVPKTVAQRRESIVGFVYSPFRMGDLMQGIQGPGVPELRLQIFDGAAQDADSLMYDGGSTRTSGSAKFETTLPFRFAGHDWSLVMSSEPVFEDEHNSVAAKLVLGGGIITSLLVFGVQWSFATTGRRAQALAEEMTESLEARTIELARSNEELEQFAYAASHDLRSPLSAISNLASWLEEDMGDALKAEWREHLTLMRSRISRLEALLDGLLQYSRIGRSVHDIQYVDANVLAKDIVDLAYVPPGFSITISPDLPDFFTAISPLSHVIQNLVANAVKHHDRDTGHIEIKAQDQGSHVCFTVSDDGPGIPLEFHERIFGMFETLKRRDEVEGSGMGLAIVKRYVTTYGGTIRIESLPDRGTAFRFTWRKSPPPASSSPAG